MDRPQTQVFTKTVTIDAPTAKVWYALTDTGSMKQWMSEEMLSIETNWQVGSPMIIHGESHWVQFVNKGMVLQFEPEQALQYSHLSSLSRLPDVQASYTLIGFALEPTEDKTVVTINVTNFPTESIYRHFAFYWNVTMELLKKFVEEE